MKITKIFFIILILMCSTQSKANQIEEELKNKILKNIRCLICQGQSVYDSESDFANSIKLIVERKIVDGSSEKQIYDFLKEKYGQWILYEPELSKNTYILWLLPILLFLFGGAIIYKNLKINNKD
ncbi:cytochrome c-type biogenesis protein CcmH [Candidatus Pelagibacter sp.]|mgnify:FL=1|nr:cytochrome c-type biogenesis protein CcmH [Candidatus Pelagibacter sp.]|tara:strand:+ start:685 stop:1059 length:375 start_codon:yes stop_codon:yes gene_type:complete